MNLPIRLLLLAGIFLPFCLSAQPICGFDKIHQEQMRTNPAYRKAIESTDASIQKYIEQHQNDPQLKTAAALYTIPVVVHVVHTGGAVGT
ncbi:MAG: hypothetical protein KGO82_14505, partial [Bacteroidota bacterium]|nr:hypothetical protein [Bacteroidota bacterium]